MVPGASASKSFACKIDDVPTGAARIVSIGRLRIGIFRVGAEYMAMLNICPHRGGKLCEGPVCGTTAYSKTAEFIYDRAGEIVRCAWHGWEFDIRSGKCLADDKLKARTFPVHVEGNDIYLDL
ncbi:MAG: Rieske (2Fe-2S) protein [Rhizobiaceae bacterium]|jgi:nitrite reductase/ring-hydroxylating ferredoxin subunit|nr:MAG: Rieske (2Fe-2S) protein [Rhizobiaceae bacterium]